MTEENNGPITLSEAEAWLESLRPLLPLNAGCWEAITTAPSQQTGTQASTLESYSTTATPFFRPYSKMLTI